tara:strand:- start:1133 stop:1969 length:837 start_codon:yes stop_codon:yes gene_type:complete
MDRQVKQKKINTLQLFLYVVPITIFFTPALSSETIIIGGSSKPSVEVNLEAIDNNSPKNLRNLAHIKGQKNIEILLTPPQSMKKHVHKSIVVNALPKADKKIVIRSNNQLSTKKKNKYNNTKIKNKKSIKLVKKSNSKKAVQKKLKLQPKKNKVIKNSKTVNLAVNTPKKNQPRLSQSNKFEIAFNVEQVTLSSRFHNDLILLAKTSINNNNRIQLRAYASSSGNSPSHARRVSLSRALTVRSYLIRKGVSSTNIDVRALGEPEDGSIKDRVDVVLLP